MVLNIFALPAEFTAISRDLVTLAMNNVNNSMKKCETEKVRARERSVSSEITASAITENSELHCIIRTGDRRNAFIIINRLANLCLSEGASHRRGSTAVKSDGPW